MSRCETHETTTHMAIVLALHFLGWHRTQRSERRRRCTPPLRSERIWVSALSRREILAIEEDRWIGQHSCHINACAGASIRRMTLERLTCATWTASSFLLHSG